MEAGEQYPLTPLTQLVEKVWVTAVPEQEAPV